MTGRLAAFCLLITTAYCANDVKVIITPDPITSERPVPLLLGQGSPGQLRCAVENKDIESKVRWEKCDINGRNCLPLSSDVNIYDDTRFLVKFEPPQVWVLILRTVVKQLEGTYKCYVNLKSATDSSVSDSITVKVYARPYILRLDSDTEVTRTEGQETKLRCSATGLPTPAFTWTRAGNAIMPGGGLQVLGAVLTISQVKPDHRGTYKCFAMNARGSDTINVKLRVQFKPVIKPFRSMLSQKAGYRIIIECNVEAFPEVKKEDTYWSYHVDRQDTVGQRLTKNVRFTRKSNNEATMRLDVYVQSSDYGFYYCGAENNIGSNLKVVHLTSSAIALPDKLGLIIASASMQKFSYVLLTLAVVAAKIF